MGARVVTAAVRISLAIALLALAGCAAPVVEPAATARHVPSNVAYGNDGARMHLFIFDPNEPRSLADRKAIARRTIALEPSCAWVDAPDDVLIEATNSQGARFIETMLVAPLRCSRA
ncbi:hypothetical protein BOA8489_00916 [Boseongicola aestuarii]|jgi:hypothetical protein|uniref:Lipoprotein n=1 Tax=Boseongicola aestuarii TaxID=1470561 RepID=A0A238IWG5_9RHOB|nr:hypothetical protein BOA8489_00916 [Boseongicola aestuarii]